MSANKPKQQETGRRPGQEEEEEITRQNPSQRGEQRHDQPTPDKNKNKNKKSGGFQDR
ncbi:MAG: hypothetical protein WAU45_22530 [Blastocatellia bacterium]